LPGENPLFLVAQKTIFTELISDQNKFRHRNVKPKQVFTNIRSMAGMYGM
jgi:hypothetical protein